MQFHFKWNVTLNDKLNVIQRAMSLKIECHSKWYVPQNGMSLKGNVTPNKMSLKMECTLNEMSLKWNVTQNGMLPKMECH